MQNEAPSAHVPSEHRCEQHWSLAPHELPAVLQEVLSAWHAPFVQVPPQHSLPAVQAPWSETQLAAQVPPEQTKLRQSVAAVQAPPLGTLPTPEPVPVPVPPSAEVLPAAPSDCVPEASTPA